MKPRKKGASSEAPLVECLDGLSRPAWRDDPLKNDVVRLFHVRPGTPFFPCRGCGLTVCPVLVEDKVLLMRYVVEDARHAGIWDYYAPAHLCRHMAPVEAEQTEESELEHFTRMTFAHLSHCCEAPLDESQVIMAKGRHQGHGPRICSKCRKVVFRV